METASTPKPKTTAMVSTQGNHFGLSRVCLVGGNVGGLEIASFEAGLSFEANDRTITFLQCIPKNRLNGGYL